MEFLKKNWICLPHIYSPLIIRTKKETEYQKQKKKQICLQTFLQSCKMQAILKNIQTMHHSNQTGSKLSEAIVVRLRNLPQTTS